MSKPKLIYFDAPVSRGEECRLAMHVAGIDFDDVRLSRDAWLALKPTTPFGVVPLLEMPGKPVLAQSNAILVYVGRLHDLHPKDPFEAAQHEGMMEYVEELRYTVTPSMRMPDGDAKKKAREELATSFLPTWGGNVEKHIANDGPFFAGRAMNVVDLKLHMIVRWFAAGKVDHIPADVFAPFPKLTRVHDAVRDDARIKAWYAKS